MWNRWMQIIPSQSSTQKFIICKFEGLQVKHNIEPPITDPKELAAVKNCFRNLLNGAPSVSERPKSVEFMVTNCIIKESLIRNQ
jgi:hypothetical protein